jgi:hypothetical protein
MRCASHMVALLKSAIERTEKILTKRLPRRRRTCLATVLGSKRTSEQRKWDRALQMHVLYPAKHERMLIRILVMRCASHMVALLKSAIERTEKILTKRLPRRRRTQHGRPRQQTHVGAAQMGPRVADARFVPGQARTDVKRFSFSLEGYMPAMAVAL